ncbi:MAG: hypothetical protein Q4G33_04600 [bacterium]|nr:hypothetical protein [bacterium]
MENKENKTALSESADLKTAEESIKGKKSKRASEPKQEESKYSPADIVAAYKRFGVSKMLIKAAMLNSGATEAMTVSEAESLIDKYKKS